MLYADHTIKAMAGAQFSTPMIIEETVLANHTKGQLRCEHLKEAQKLARDLLADIDAAIAAETGVQPQAPTERKNLELVKS